ncbi:MAG: DUF63 family protein [Methanosarcinaceae archaeon]|nr:DUF63 family protein [Methanosarcinaceae archaeon]
MISLIDKISQFVSTYYVDPIIYDSGYNPINTITWALVLGICIFGVVRLLERIKVTINERFILSVMPFVVAGSSLRVIEDAGVFKPPLQYLFITPTIYFVVFAVTVVCLLVSRWLHNAGKVKDLHATFAAFGTIWFAANVLVLLCVEDIVRPYVPVLILGGGTLIAFLVYKLTEYGGFALLSNRLNLSILWVHLLDASSTIVGIDMLGYYEKHVVPAYLIDLTGTAIVMYPLKLAIFLPVLYLLDSQFDEDDESQTLKTFVKMVIIVLGLSPACRNTIRMTFGI